VTGTGLFTVNTAPPSITSHNPITGVSGTQVTIVGSYFGAARGGSTVTFNGTAVSNYVGWSDTLVTVEAPVGGTTGNIVANVGGQSSSGTHTFTYNTPSITSVTPNQANIGDSVVIAGSNFGTVPGGSRSTATNKVTLGATQLTDAQVTAWTNASITVTIPTGLKAGSYNFVVRAGGNDSGTSAFTVTPEVTSVSGAPYYIGNATITINGSGFGAAQGSSTVTVGGQNLTGITWGATQITGVLPNNIAAGPQNVVVTVNPGALATNASSINCVPYISGLVLNSGYVGDSVTINGYGFGGARGTSAITFNGTAVTSYTSWSNTSVQVVVPTGASTGNVILTVNPGSYASNGQTFTVSATSFTSVTPNSGNQGATLNGVAIVGTGTHFGGTTAVDFGPNITVSNISVTDITHLTCNIVISASAATGARNVIVTTGGETVTGTNVFTVNVPPGPNPFIYEKAGGIMMAYPNPFNPDDKANPLKMLFNAATGEAVDIYIFDTNGRVIYQNRDAQLLADRTAQWDGETSYGEVVDNGLYLIRIIKDGKLVAKAKILVIKK
jgi:hypothetical protein